MILAKNNYQLLNTLANNFSVTLLVLLPFTLLTGNFIPDLSIVIISLLFIIKIIWNGDFELINKKIFFSFIVFYFIICFTSIISNKPFISLSSSLLYIRFGIFSLAVCYLIQKNENVIKIFTIFFFATFLFALIDGYYQFFFDESIFGFVATSPNRMVLPLNDKMYLGGYLSRLFPLLIALLIYNFKYSRINILIASILLITTDVLVFITGERTALGLMLITTILFIVFLSKFKFIRFITLAISVISIIVISFSSPEITKRNITYTLNQLELNDNSLFNEENKTKKLFENGPRIFSVEHERTYLTSYNMFKHNIIFGIGPNLFRYYCEGTIYDSGRYSCSSHPHNTYMQLAAETGIAGLLFIIFLFFYLSYNFIKIIFTKIFYNKSLYSDTFICLLICIFLTTWPFLPTQNFFNGYINIIYYLPIGFILYFINKKIF